MAKFKANYLVNCHEYKHLPARKVSWNEFYLEYENFCSKFLRQKLQKLEIVNFDKISSNLHYLSIFRKLKKMENF